MKSFCFKSTLWCVTILVIGVLGFPIPGFSVESETSQKAIFAGGCFWCMEEAFEKVDGVIAVTSGYIGGMVPKPTYKQVSAGGTGHAEAIEIIFDPQQVTYQQLLKVFWKNIDPTVENSQFCDHGSQYRAGIFYLNPTQKELALASKKNIMDTKSFPGPIHTEVTKAEKFYLAEDYHQDFYKKNPFQYKFYKWNCGRAQRLEQLWGQS